MFFALALDLRYRKRIVLTQRKSMRRKISRTEFGKQITKEYCVSNGKLPVIFEGDETYIEIDSVDELATIAKKTGCVVAICEDGEIWIDG